MTSYATQFFTSAGMSTLAAFNLNIVVTSMNLVGCILEFFIIGLCGRRPLLLAGEGMLAGCLLLIGILGSLPETSHTAQGIGAFMVMIKWDFECRGVADFQQPPVSRHDRPDQ